MARFQKGAQGIHQAARLIIPRMDIKSLILPLLPDIVRTLFEILNDKDQSGSARVQAAHELLDRSVGKAAQQVTVTEDRNPLQSLTDAQLLQRLDDLRRQAAPMIEGKAVEVP